LSKHAPLQSQDNQSPGHLQRQRASTLSDVLAFAQCATRVPKCPPDASDPGESVGSGPLRSVLLVDIYGNSDGPLCTGRQIRQNTGATLSEDFGRGTNDSLGQWFVKRP